MKKTLFGLVMMCAMVLFACCTSEPKLEGEWVGDAKALMGDTNKDLDAAEFVITITPETIGMLVDLQGKMEEKDGNIELGIKASVEGAYTRQDSILNLTLDPKKANLDVYKFEMQLDEKTKKFMEAAGMTEDKLKESLKAEMRPEEMVKDLPNDKLIIRELTETTLVLVDDKGVAMTFKRK